MDIKIDKRFDTDEELVLDIEVGAQALEELLEQAYGAVMAQHKKNGLLQEEDDRVFLTERGRDLANRVMADFLQ